MTPTDITNALRQKDIEKTLALEEIRNAEALHASGFAGKLCVSLIGVRGFDGQSSGANLTYTLTPLDYGEAAPADESKGSIAGHLLISRDVVLSLCLTVPMTESLAVVETPPSLDAEIIPEELKEKTDDAATTTTTSYYAEFDCKELPEEGYMQLELIGKNEGQIYADLKFVIKVSYEEFSKVILHKTTEVDQIQQQMKDLHNSVKEAGRSKSGKVKKQKKNTAGSEKTVQYVSEGDDAGPSALEIARNTAVTVGMFFVATHSCWLFGAAVLCISYCGEYASI